MVESGAEVFRALEIVGIAPRSRLSCCDWWFKTSGWMSPSAEHSIASSFSSSAPLDCEKMWPKWSCCESNWPPTTSSGSHSDAGGSERRRPASGGSTWLLGCLLLATYHGRMSRKQPELWQRISFRVYGRLNYGRHGCNSVNKPLRHALQSIPRIFPGYSPTPYTPRASPSGKYTWYRMKRVSNPYI